MVLRFLTITFTISGCAVLNGIGGSTTGPSGSTPNEEKANVPIDDPIGDEEEGIDAISRRLKEFSRALTAKDFARAGKLLRRAERSTEEPDELTRGHPEFDDKVEAVARAKQRFERAVEQDRIERRNAVVAELIEDGNRTLADARALFSEISSRTPTSEDVDALSEIISLLVKLRTSGSQYEGLAQYKSHAENRDLQADALRTRLKLAQWQIATSAYLEAPIERAQHALNQGKASEDRSVRLKALMVATTAYKQCLDQFRELVNRPDYDGERLVRTSVGDQSLAATQQTCAERHDRMSGQLAAVQWKSLVKSVLAEVSASLAAYRSAPTSEHRLKANTAAAAALKSCGIQMANAAKQKGFERNKAFKSPFGEKSVPQIEKACRKRRTELNRERPSLVWRAEVDGFAKTLNVVVQKETHARKQKDPARRANVWLEAKAALQSCAQSVATLRRKQNADRKHVTESAFGRLTLQDLESVCAKRAADAGDAAEAAQHEQEIAGFLSTVTGEEATLAREKGIPTKIETVPGGRVFYYPDGPNTFKKYGFDESGRAVDFEARWQKTFETVARNVTAALTALKAARTGAELKTATDAAILELERCASTLDNAKTKAGANPKMKQSSPLGTLGFEQMHDACVKHGQQLRRRMLAIDWQISLEAIADRAAGAQTTITQNRASRASGMERVELIGRALGSLEECVEQAERLAAKPGATESLRIRNSVFGRIARKDLIGACEKSKAEGLVALGEARKTLKLEEFIAQAKNDEKNVARREGLPTRIETVGQGRVFIYVTNKDRAKRIAFDRDGRRVSEAALRASSQEKR